jgi:putative aldouronate transport system substrate-binding protein
MGEIDGFKEQITNLDGKIYGFPSYNACFHCENSQRMWLNQGWLDKLKLKAPTTTEEFYNVLKAFKNDDPNGNGKQDEIPLTSNIDGWHSELDGFLMNPFIISFTQGYSDMKLRLSAADGVIDSIADKDGYREGLRYINKLYAEGLIDPNAVTQKSNELKALFADPANDIVGAVPTGTMILNVDVNKNNETYSRYHAIAPLKGPTGLQQSPTFTVAPVAAQVCISKVCKYPEVVARWVDGFFDFYSADAYLVPVSRQCGIEGTDWRWGKEGEVGLDGKAQAKIVFINNPNDPSQNRCWANGEGPYVWSAGMRLGLLSDPTKSLYDPDMVDPLLYDVSKNLMEPYAAKDWKIVPPIKYTSDESTQLSTLTVDLKKYISENYAAFVSGQKSLDTDWDSYVSGLKSIGLDKYLQIVNTGYARQYGSK